MYYNPHEPTWEVICKKGVPMNSNENNGKLVEYLIEDQYTIDDTGLRVQCRYYFRIWANAGLEKRFEKIEGVTDAFTVGGPTQYDIYIDHRYDIEFIKKEVEAVIICSLGNKTLS